jgi:hypothetical protein
MSAEKEAAKIVRDALSEASRIKHPYRTAAESFDALATRSDQLTTADFLSAIHVAHQELDAHGLQGLDRALLPASLGDMTMTRDSLRRRAARSVTIAGATLTTLLGLFASAVKAHGIDAALIGWWPALPFVWAALRTLVRSGDVRVMADSLDDLLRRVRVLLDRRDSPAAVRVAAVSVPATVAELRDEADVHTIESRKVKP